MIVTIINACTYNINAASEMAYEIEYSEGTRVRAVISKTKFIRKEWNDGGVWKAVGKPYIINKNKKRDAEKIVDSVKNFIIFL